MKLSHKVSAIAMLAVFATATAASANRTYYREDVNAPRKQYSCAKLIDNSASANVVHKGGANTPKGINDIAFDNCYPVMASTDRAYRDGTYRDRDASTTVERKERTTTYKRSY